VLKALKALDKTFPAISCINCMPEAVGRHSLGSPPLRRQVLRTHLPSVTVHYFCYNFISDFVSGKMSPVFSVTIRSKCSHF